MIEVKNTLNGKLNASIVKEYPELEEITVIPTLDEQELKSDKYGYSKITIEGIPATDVTIAPATNEQTKTGIFKSVTVNAIEGQELNLNPSEEQQNYEGVFLGVNINPIQVEEITTDLDFSSSDTIELTAQEGVYIKKATINKDANLSPENIKSGVTISGVSGDVADTSDADATSDDIIAGKTAYVANEKIAGTYVPLDTSDATATAEDVVEGKTAYVNGEKIVGTRILVDYENLEYIESTGTQYIDTGIIPTNHKLEIRFQYTEANNDTSLFGEDSFRYHLTWYSNRWYYYCGGNTEYNISTTNCTDIQTIIFNNDNNKITFNSGEAGSTNDGTSTADTNLFLFCRRWGGEANRHSSARIFYCKIYDKTTDKLVRYFIPAKSNINNEIGMFDLIEQKFYENAGTGSFIAKGIANLENIKYLTDGLVSYFNFNGKLKEQIFQILTTNYGLTFETDDELNKTVCKSNNGYGLFNTVDLPKNNFTLSILAKSDGTNTEANHMLFGYVDKTEGGQLNSIVLKVSSGILHAEYSYGSTATTFNVNDNTWHRYTVTVENSSIIKIYVDDQLVAEDTQSLNLASNAYGFIGSWHPAYQFYFNGWLSDALIYNRVLTAEEIANNYNQSNLI